MNKMFNGTERLQLFGLEIIALISQGKSEMIEQVEQHIDDGDLIQYIREIYKEMKEESLVFVMIMKDYY